MSDEMAQALVAELAQIKTELWEVRKAVAKAGKIAGLPQWYSLALVVLGVLAMVVANIITQ